MKKINLDGQELIVLLSTKDPHYSEDRTDVVVLRGATLQNLTIHNDLIEGHYEADWGLEIAEGVTLDSSDADFISLEALAWFDADAIIGNAIAFNEMAREKTLELVAEEVTSLRERLYQLEARRDSL